MYRRYKHVSLNSPGLLVKATMYPAVRSRVAWKKQRADAHARTSYAISPRREEERRRGGMAHRSEFSHMIFATELTPYGVLSILYEARSE